MLAAACPGTPHAEILAALGEHAAALRRKAAEMTDEAAAVERLAFGRFFLAGLAFRGGTLAAGALRLALTFFRAGAISRLRLRSERRRPPGRCG